MTAQQPTIYLIDYLANHTRCIEEIAQLKFNHWYHTSPERPWEVWLSEIEESARIDTPPLTLVALYDLGNDVRDLAGFVSLIHIDEKQGIAQSLWMITLYVKEAYRNKGIGAHLIQRCITESRKLDYPAVYLWTESKELTSYYAKRGWKQCDIDEESSEKITVMRNG